VKGGVLGALKREPNAENVILIFRAGVKSETRRRKRRSQRAGEKFSSRKTYEASWGTALDKSAEKISCHDKDEAVKPREGLGDKPQDVQGGVQSSYTAPPLHCAT